MFTFRQVLCSQTVELNPKVLLGKTASESNGFKPARAERLSPVGRKPISGKKPPFTFLPLFPPPAFPGVVSLQEGLSLPWLCPCCPECRCFVFVSVWLFYVIFPLFCTSCSSDFLSYHPCDCAPGEIPKRSPSYEEESLETLLCSSYSNSYLQW